MTVNRYISVVCDTCLTDATPERTTREARKSAKAEGYVHHYLFDSDHCPSCEESCTSFTCCEPAKAVLR